MTTYDKGIQAKLDSARNKLEELRAGVRTFAETQRNKVQMIQIGEKSWITRLKEKFDAPPIKWSILTGEIAIISDRHLTIWFIDLFVKVAKTRQGKTNFPSFGR